MGRNKQDNMKIKANRIELTQIEKVHCPNDRPAGSVTVYAIRFANRAIAVLITLLAANHGALLQAEGLRSIVPGAFGLDRAGGRFAQVEDSSAVWHNPANLVFLTNAEVQLTPSVVYLQVDYSGASGVETSTENPWKPVPTLFASAPIQGGDFVLGLGITAPYGLSVDWDQDPSSPFHYSAPYSTGMKTLNINPTLSVRLLENLSLGLGFDAMWSELDIKQYYPWVAFPGSVGGEPDGDAQFKGNGWGWGVNVALTWEFVTNNRVAVTFRSQQTVAYDGDFTINNITPTAAALGATASSGFSTQIGFPNIVGVGYGLRLSDRIRIEVNAEWLQWSRFQSLSLDIDNNSFLLPSTAVPQDWNDSFTAGIAGDYRISDHFIARLGYLYYNSPVPDETFSPSIPDSNQHVFTFGLGYHSGHHSVEAAYGLDLYEDREISGNVNPSYDGDYSWNVHLFSLSYRYTF